MKRHEVPWRPLGITGRSFKMPKYKKDGGAPTLTPADKFYKHFCKMAEVVSYRHEHPKATVEEAANAVGTSEGSYKGFCKTYKEQVRHLRTDPEAAKAFAEFGISRDKERFGDTDRDK